MKDEAYSHKLKKRRERALKGDKDRKLIRMRRRMLNQLVALDNPLYFGNSITRLNKELGNAESSTVESPTSETSEEQDPKLQRAIAAERVSLGRAVQEQKGSSKG